jgi:hypothetical protein
MRVRLSTVVLGIITVAGMLGLIIGISGYAMSGSFAVAHPDRQAHWSDVAVLYLVLSAVSLVAGGGSVALLLRRGSR